MYKIGKKLLKVTEKSNQTFLLNLVGDDMNKVYKVVWNASLGIWVAVSEIAKGKTKKATKVQTVGIAVAIIGAVSFSPDAFAGFGAGGGTLGDNGSTCTVTPNSTGGTSTTGSGSISIAGTGKPTCASGTFATAVGNNAQALGSSTSTYGSGSRAQGKGVQPLLVMMPKLLRQTL